MQAFKADALLSAAFFFNTVCWDYIKFPCVYVEDITFRRISFRIETKDVDIRISDRIGIEDVGIRMPSPFLGNIESDYGRSVLVPTLEIGSGLDLYLFAFISTIAGIPFHAGLFETVECDGNNELGEDRAVAVTADVGIGPRPEIGNRDIS